MRIVAISDTHGQHRKLKIPQCNWLFHAGDITMKGESHILEDFNQWLGELKQNGTIGEAYVIAGNHDISLEKDPEYGYKVLSNAMYLLNDRLLLPNGMSVLGVPYTPEFLNWSFNLPRGEEYPPSRGVYTLRELWREMDYADILLTHGPPKYTLDFTLEGKSVGDLDFRNWISYHCPKYVFCGHIHEGYGSMIVEDPFEEKETAIYNCSSLNRFYKCVNPPKIIDLL